MEANFPFHIRHLWHGTVTVLLAKTENMAKAIAQDSGSSVSGDAYSEELSVNHACEVALSG